MSVETLWEETAPNRSTPSGTSTMIRVEAPDRLILKNLSMQTGRSMVTLVAFAIRALPQTLKDVGVLLGEEAS